MIGIYAIKCGSNGKVYIGQSKNMNQRISLHKCNLKHLRHPNKQLQEDYNKYGGDSFSFIVLKQLEQDNFCQSQLDDLEVYFIKAYNSTDSSCGYNTESGGICFGHMIEETKKKLSASNIGKRKGKTLSEQTKMLMRKNHSHYWLGKKMSDVARENMSKARKGKPSHLKGKKQTEEHIKKRTECQKGKIWVHNQTETRFIPNCQKEEFLSKGYVLGRPFKKRNRKTTE